jgi:RNA polymerase sigma-70 factor, ECF subfamily
MEFSVKRLKNKDKNEFKRLVKTYQKPLYFYLFKVLKEHESVNDVLQETFIKVYENLHKFREESHLKTWVYRIATNTALSYLKSVKRHATESIHENVIELKESFEEKTIEAEISFTTAVDECLHFLSPTQQLVFRLRKMNGLSIQETAIKMDCSIASVKKNLHVAIQKLRLQIKKKYPKEIWN